MRLPRRLLCSLGPEVLEFRAILKQGELPKSVLNMGGRIFKALLSVFFLHYMCNDCGVVSARKNFHDADRWLPVGYGTGKHPSWISKGKLWQLLNVDRLLLSLMGR